MKIYNELNQLFNQDKNRLLSIYFTAGYPNLADTQEIIERLTKAGVDFIEVGSAYNDPIADGETIQHSANQALANGMSVEVLFSQLRALKQKKLQSDEEIVPLIWMGYFNLIIAYGIEKFCLDARESGISGLIVPDLSIDYFDQYQQIFEKYGLNFIFMISPFTPIKRIKEIDKKTNLFIYVTSGQSTTGQNSMINKAFLQKLKALDLKNPMVIGFNIKDKESFDAATHYGKGAIIGSAFIQFLRSNPLNLISDFIDSIKS